MTVDPAERQQPITRDGPPGTASPSERGGFLRHRVSAWTSVLVLLAGASVILTASSPSDPDVYWHRVLGARWLSGHWSLDPDPISYTSGHWFSTSWATEALYALLVDVFGYGALTWLRLAVAAAFYVGLGLLVRNFASPVAAVVTFTLVGLPAFPLFQDRPQTLSLVLLLVLIAAAYRALDDRGLPHPVAVAAFTWVWANLHGLWCLVPATLVVLTIGFLLDRRPESNARARRTGMLAVVALAAAAVTPVGPQLLTSPFRVTSAASSISEWQPTQLWLPLAWGLAAILLLIVLGWARLPAKAPARELVFVLAFAVLGFSAFRNAVPASLMLAPLAARSLEALLPGLRRSTLATPRWVPLVLVLVVAALAVGKYAQKPAIPTTAPSRVTSYLAAGSEPARVMTAYGVSGYVREFGGDNVRLAIDGRTDRYGDTAIERYNAAMNGVRGWRQVISKYDPDYVVAERAQPIGPLLAGDGWTRVVIDGQFVMYARPGLAPRL